MNLHHVQGKDKYDEGMRVMGIASDEGLLNPDPKKHGAMIWNGMKNYRNFLCSKVVEVSNYVAKMDTLKDKKGKLIKYSFSAPSDDKVKEFKNKGELLAILEPNLKSFIVDQSPVDEYSVIKDVYLGLTKSQLVKEGEKSLHWIGKTFDHAPSVAVLASLSSIQKDILSARSVAISYLQGKVGAGEYSFNKVMALAYPDQAVVNGGEEFTMSVLMAAFDSERQPVVNPEQGTAMAARQGVGIVKLRAPNSGEMKITGTVTIRKKNGQEKTERYETKVAVVPPMGTVTLPEFGIMYAGYGNKVTAVAGGSKGETTISVAGASSTKSTFNVNGQNFNGWIVKPSGYGGVTITVNGKDSQGNSKSFGKFTYKVKPFPLPKISTTTISKTAGATLSAGLDPSSPLAPPAFKVQGGEVSIGDGLPFTGNRIPGTLIAKAKLNKTITVLVRVFNPITGKTEVVSQPLTVKP